MNAVRFAPANWTVPVATFALRHLGERLASGDRPSLAQLASAVAQIYSGLTESYKKVSLSDRAQIDVAAAPILAALH